MAKKKLLIIAGHGEGDPGACSIWGQEADYTRELATMVKKSIGNKMSVTMYDQKKNCYAQSKRGNVPEYAKYDMTLEIHFNAKGKKDPYGDGHFTGVGGYIHPDNAGKKVARAIIDRVVALGFKEWMLGTSTGLLNLNNAQRQGAKYFLLETAFVDDGDDMNFYCNHVDAFAKAIAQGVMDGLGMDSSAGDVPKKEYWRVRKSWEDTKSQKYAMETKEAAILVCPAGYSVFDPSGNCVYLKEAYGTQAQAFEGCAEEEYIEAVGTMYTEDERKNGILACVSLAQSILESGYGQTDLAQIGNNMHGMKCNLSGNTWSGTTWNGESFYEKLSSEVENGQEVMRRSQFRCYECIEDSIADHAAYLLNAANGKKRRFEGIQGEKDYRKAIQIIKAGGYATDPEYVNKICNIIERWNLMRFNVRNSELDQKLEIPEQKPDTPDQKPETSDQGGQEENRQVLYGIFTDADILSILSEPQKSGKVVGYIQEPEGKKKEYHIVEEQNGYGKLLSEAGWVDLAHVKKWMYAVQTTCNMLNIRKKASLDSPVVGTISEPEGRKVSYHIDKEKNGFGHLLSGAGWVSLEYIEKV
ncbi:hypothetical protein D7Y05_08165 [bacterium 1XD42-54]|nr:hypothetical protein D7Y05_08165 [bacterium 1XD42-54]